jgi:hypothetical protein
VTNKEGSQQTVKFNIAVGKVHVTDTYGNIPVAVYLDFGPTLAKTEISDEVLNAAAYEAISEIYGNPVLQNMLASYGIVVNPNLSPIIAGGETASGVRDFDTNKVLSKAVFVKVMGVEKGIAYIRMLGREIGLKSHTSIMRPLSNVAIGLDFTSDINVSISGIDALKKRIDSLAKMQVSVISASNVEKVFGKGLRFSAVQWQELVRYSAGKGIMLVNSADPVAMALLQQELNINERRTLAIDGNLNIVNIPDATRSLYLQLTFNQSTLTGTDAADAIAKIIADGIKESKAGVIEIPFSLINNGANSEDGFMENTMLKPIMDAIKVRITKFKPATPQEYFALGKRAGYSINLPLDTQRLSDAGMNVLIGIMNAGFSEDSMSVKTLANSINKMRTLQGWEGLDLINSDRMENNAQIMGFMYAVAARLQEKGEKGFAGFEDQNLYKTYGMVRFEAVLKDNHVCTDRSVLAQWAALDKILQGMIDSGESKAAVSSRLNAFIQGPNGLMIALNGGILDPKAYDSDTMKLIVEMIAKYADKALPDFKELLKDTANQASDMTIGTKLVQAAG